MSLFTYLVVISLTLCTTVSQTNIDGKFPAHDLQLAGWLALPTTRSTLYCIRHSHTLYFPILAPLQGKLFLCCPNRCR